MATQKKHILVIKHGAFGDIILCTGPFRALREHHGDDHITLLTTDPFVGFARQMQIFDHIICDRRPKGIAGLLWMMHMARVLRGQHYDRVYDLQHSTRTDVYYRAVSFMRSIEWSGIAQGCSHPHTNPNRDSLHSVDRTAEQLHMAGLGPYAPYDLNWLDGDISHFRLPARYALLVPTAAPKRPEKVWPIEHFGALAHHLVGVGIVPVVIGTKADQPAAKIIQRIAPQTIDLTGQTSFGQLAAVGRQATLAIGNDTGPMHLFAPLECPCTVVFSHASEPSQTAPRGPDVTILQRPHLDQLTVEDVLVSESIQRQLESV